MKTSHEEVTKFLDSEGIGKGTNITLHMCNCLIRDFANDREVKTPTELPFAVVIETIKAIQKGQRSTLFRTWKYDIEALRELCFVLGYADDTLDC